MSMAGAVTAKSSPMLKMRGEKWWEAANLVALRHASRITHHASRLRFPRIEVFPQVSAALGRNLIDRSIAREGDSDHQREAARRRAAGVATVAPGLAPGEQVEAGEAITPAVPGEGPLD